MIEYDFWDDRTYEYNFGDDRTLCGVRDSGDEYLNEEKVFFYE